MLFQRGYRHLSSYLLLSSQVPVKYKTAAGSSGRLEGDIFSDGPGRMDGGRGQTSVGWPIIIRAKKEGRGYPRLYDTLHDCSTRSPQQIATLIMNRPGTGTV